MSKEQAGISTGKGFCSQPMFNKVEWIDVNGGEPITLDKNNTTGHYIDLPIPLEDGKTYIFKMTFKNSSTTVTEGYELVNKDINLFILPYMKSKMSEAGQTLFTNRSNCSCGWAENLTFGFRCIYTARPDKITLQEETFSGDVMFSTDVAIKYAELC